MLVEVVPPFFVDSHILCRSSLALSRESLGLGVLDHLPDMLRMHRVQHCEKVFSIRLPVGWIIILQILHHFGILLELREDVLDAEFVVFGHDHRTFLTDLEQLLITPKHSSDKVTVHSGHRRHIELNCANRIR